MRRGFYSSKKFNLNGNLSYVTLTKNMDIKPQNVKKGSALVVETKGKPGLCMNENNSRPLKFKIKGGL